MPYLIEQIVSCAIKTFKKDISENSFEENHQLLLQLLNNLKAKDLNLNQKAIDYFTKLKNFCSYSHLYKNHDVNLSIFSVSPMSKIPLHDHQKMNGIIKVLTGKIKITSFNFLPDNNFRPPDVFLNYFPLNFDKNKLIAVQQNPDKILTSENSPHVLTPINGNLHEITTASDCETGASFLDVLSPPYDEKRNRNCQYYKIIGKKKINEHPYEIFWLQKISQPKDYKCINFEYSGPKINEKQVFD